MSFHKELMPIEYLLKRVKYYKRMAGKYQRIIDNPSKLEKLQSVAGREGLFSEDNLKRLINHFKLNAIMFDRAALILSQNM